MKTQNIIITVLILILVLTITGSTIVAKVRQPDISVGFIPGASGVEDTDPDNLGQSQPTSEPVTMLPPVSVPPVSVQPVTLPPVITPPPEPDPEIAAQIERIAQLYGAEGVQVAVVRDGVVAESYAWGWATRDTDPMTADHKLRVASISKVIIGMAAMLLEEEGKIDLDAELGTYWGVTARNPYYPDEPITLRHVLTHLSSIYQYDDTGAQSYESVLEKLARGYVRTRPGQVSSWLYNNHAFRVLGMTLELASNQRLDDILKEKLWTAMDIDAAFGSGDIQAVDKLTTIYWESGYVGLSIQEQLQRHAPDTPATDGSYYAGGLTISSVDLAKIISLLVNDGVYDGQQLLSAASVDEMQTCLEQPLSDGSYQAQPLFYWPGMYGREGIYYHTGSAFGVYNCFSYDPVTGDGVVVLTTGAKGDKDKHDVYKICSEINQYIYDAIA